ncbi:hypothetical protein FA15DRAFT_664993 [Coprinopsis marcescibilis]|uniref:Uncharacterized protein n=1 Tax=Coprinopsis marcescibilis TaxID=230819 RepID=A0A5C3LA60_COPMA|nr:hypothetical protein FA15DRAFT_664993 [Coprinopsis marcescibilis]
MESGRAVIGELVALRARLYPEGGFRPMFKSLSLVSKNLHTIALGYLFRELTIDSANRARTLQQLRQSSTYINLPNPLQYITSLTVISYLDNNEADEGVDGPSWMIQEPLLPPLLTDIHTNIANIRNLHSLRLFTSRSIKWTECSEELRSALLIMVLSTRPRNFSVGGFNGLPSTVLFKVMLHAEVLEVESVVLSTPGLSNTTHGIPVRSHLETGLLSAPLRVFSVVTSPGVVPTLVRHLQQTPFSPIRFEDVKQLAFSIDVQELPATVSMIERFAECSELETLELAPTGNFGTLDGVIGVGAATPNSLALPRRVFANLQCLDLEFESIYIDTRGQMSVPVLLKHLFGPSDGDIRHRRNEIQRLKVLTIRVCFAIEAEPTGLEQIAHRDTLSWKGLDEALARFAPELQDVDIRIICLSESEHRMMSNAELRVIEDMVRGNFTGMEGTASVDFSLRVTAGSQT